MALQITLCRSTLLLLAALLLAALLLATQAQPGEACFLWPPLNHPFQPNGLMQPFGQQQVPFGQQPFGQQPFGQQPLPFGQQPQQQPFGQQGVLPNQG